MKKQELTQELLHNIFLYNKETGIFTFKERNIDMGSYNVFNSRFANKETGTLNKKNGYIILAIYNKTYLAHRLAWLYEYGYLPDVQIDHKDNIRHHNWISNLREATNKQNSENRHTASCSNKSTGLLGSSYDKRSGKFRSVITRNGKMIHLGTFNTAEEAHQRYLEEKRKIHEFNML
jgi:hypothetical protein